MKELKKQWKYFNFKKLIICMIILVSFIILVRLIFKNNLIEGFTEMDIRDLALIEYEFRNYGENSNGVNLTDAELEKRIVWDNRIYLLQPSKATNKKYSFWNINDDEAYDFSQNTAILKSLGTSINTESNNEPPSKPVMAIKNGKYASLEKYEKVVELGSDEFSDLDLDYNYLRERKLKDLQLVQTDVKKRITGLQNLENYYKASLLVNDNYIKTSVEPFMKEILLNYVITPIAIQNPMLGSIGFDSITLQSCMENNGVYTSLNNTTTGGAGEIIIMEKIPFGSTLTISNTPNLGSPLVLREIYNVNKTYKKYLRRLINSNSNYSFPTSSTTTTITTIPNLTSSHLLSSDYIENYNWYQNYYNLNDTINTFYTAYSNIFTKENKLYESYFYFEEERETTNPLVLPRHKLENMWPYKTTIYSSDKENILSPESFYLNLINDKLRYKVDTKNTNNMDPPITRTISKTVDIDFGSRRCNFYELQKNPKINKEIIQYLAYMPDDHNLKDYQNGEYDNSGQDIGLNNFGRLMANIDRTVGQQIRRFMTYRTPNDEQRRNLQLSHISFQHFKTENDKKINAINTNILDYITEEDKRVLQHTNTSAEVSLLNRYLNGLSEYNFDTAFINYDVATINNIIKKHLHFTLFNYNIQYYMATGRSIQSYSIDVNDLVSKIRNTLFEDAKKLQKYVLSNNTIMTEYKARMNPKVKLATNRGIIKNLYYLKKFDLLLTKIQTNLLPFPSLKVIRPIPPKGYKVLGDIILSSKAGIRQRIPQPTSGTATTTTSSGTTTTNPLTIRGDRNDIAGGTDYITFQLQKYVAIPETCVKRVREWRDTDKVFEIREAGKVLQIYNNPYTNTISVTTNRKKPEGYVEKLIACVKECDAVSSLIKTDNCARKLYKTKKSLEGGSIVNPNLADSEENKFYLNKIQARAEYIRNLDKKARELQLTQDKTRLLNMEANRGKLQNYIDTQSKNIAILTDKLEKGKNKIDLNTYVYPDRVSTNQTNQTGTTSGVGSRTETVNLINNLIGQSSLPEDEKRNLTEKVNNYKMMMDNQLISPEEYDARVNSALQSCPEYDLTGLVHKDVVSDVCYGCDQ